MSNLMRSAYRRAVGAAARMTLPFRARDGRVAVFYGGARAGNLGGPQVKISLLSQRFPEQRIGYSLVYMLSNAIYLPPSILESIARAGIPIVLNQNGVFYPAWYPQGWQQENARLAHLHECASHVFYQSEFCRRCAEIYLGPRVGPSEILYNAVDIDLFSPPTERKLGPMTFLVSGKFGPATAYRLTSSIAGLAAARKGGLDVQLLVVGACDPQTAAQARALVDSLGIADAVTFRGAYARSEAPAIYRAADAYLMTKHNDPCPNVVLEALASGLPVLYSASGGTPELIGAEAGVALAVPETFEYSPTPHPDAIAEGMEKIMRARDTMSQAARVRAVARFGISAWLDRHEAVFRALVSASIH